MSFCLFSQKESFNPRTHVGCDRANTKHYDTFQRFNPRTHVGCDSILCLKSLILFQFQSTHPRRVRPLRAFKTSGKQMFQSTHPRRVRHSRFASVRVRNSFNPRTHVGCDAKIFKHINNNLCFNPRTHVGCDVTRRLNKQIEDVSIHAPT